MTETVEIQQLPIWDKMKARRAPLSFDLEVTARCNNDCKHCYINLPAGDKSAREKELTLEEIGELADEAVSLGVFWCLITGGEPLLRDDFVDIYLMLKNKGLLVSVFTNASLISNEHIDLFKKYPPRDMEVTVYGVKEEVYERVTRRRGSFSAFWRGLHLLRESGIKVRLKAMALRSNLDGLKDIFLFSKKGTKDYFRFDPFLHLRFDGNTARNREIISERLTPREIIVLEKSESERFGQLQKRCDELIMPDSSHAVCNHLFHCGTGNGSFTVGYDGSFRLCSSLWHRDCVYDLRNGNLAEAYNEFVPWVREMRSNKKVFLEGCRTCPIINLCLWCPAHAHLETGELDEPVDYFCEVAHARAKLLQEPSRQ